MIIQGGQNSNNIILRDNSATRLNNRKPDGVAFKGAEYKALALLESNPVLSLFTIDLFGMVIPRIIIDTLRNRKELGHLNWDAGRETAVRESLSGPISFFMPSLIAVGVGNHLLNSKYNKEGINTSSFINFDYLKTAKTHIDSVVTDAQKQGLVLTPQELRAKFVESILSDTSSKMQGKGLITPNTPQGAQIRDKFVKFVIENTESANIDKAIARDTSGKSVDSIRTAFIKSKETGYKDIISEIGNSISKTFGEFMVSIKGKNNKTISTSANTMVRDSLTFADDLILKAASMNNATGADQKVALTKFTENFEMLYKKLENFKRIKVAIPVVTTMAALVMIPKFNVWLTRKITGSESFPGVTGLAGSQADNTKKPGGAH